MAEIQNFIKMDKENIEKFKKLYEKNFTYEDDLVLFSFAMIEPNQKEWGTGDAFDDMGETFFCSLDEILAGKYDFRTANCPPIKVYDKMASDGLVFEAEWESFDLDDEWAVGRGRTYSGRFGYGVDFAATRQRMIELEADELRSESPFIPTNYQGYHVDSFGNVCNITYDDDTGRKLDEGDVMCVTGLAPSIYSKVYLLPVKQILETERFDHESFIEERVAAGSDVIAFKVPDFFEDLYDIEGKEIDEFSDYLRCLGSRGEQLYLLDKEGKRVACLKDVDHSEPDSEGNVYYPIMEGDFESTDDGRRDLSTEVKEKWRSKLGL